MVICDHSELLHEITELSRHNTVLQKADMHREKIWKKRVTEMQRKNADLLEAVEDMDYTKKLRAKIAELESDQREINASFHRQGWRDCQAGSNKRIAELEADLAKAKLSNVGMHNTIARMTHRNGVECVHGHFLHEHCALCEGEAK